MRFNQIRFIVNRQKNPVKALGYESFDYGFQDRAARRGGKMACLYRSFSAPNLADCRAADIEAEGQIDHVAHGRHAANA